MNDEKQPKKDNEYKKLLEKISDNQKRRKTF